jgi:hypothetical protein
VGVDNVASNKNIELYFKLLRSPEYYRLQEFNAVCFNTKVSEEPEASIFSEDGSSRVFLNVGTSTSLHGVTYWENAVIIVTVMETPSHGFCLLVFLLKNTILRNMTFTSVHMPQDSTLHSYRSVNLISFAYIM